MAAATLLMLAMGMGTIYADEKETTESDSHIASYVFVLDDGTAVPEEVSRFVPERKTGLKDGDVIENEAQPDIVTNDYVYSFVKWDQDSYTVADSDVVFTGTWTRRKRLKSSDMRTEELNLHAANETGRPSSTDFQTLRWDDFGASCWGTFEDGTRYYPSLFFVAYERENGLLKDRKICFCVQHGYSFCTDGHTIYDVSSIDEYPLLTESNKTKIVRIASYALKQKNMYWRDASGSQSGKWMNIEEALAAQIAIWMVAGDNGNSTGQRRLTMQECSTLDIGYINSRASYYYNTVANQETSDGIHLEQALYSGRVGQVFKIGKIDDPSGATITLSDGVVFCDAEGNERSSIQWDGKYFYIKTTKAMKNATQTIEALPSGQQEALFLEHPTAQNMIIAGAFVSKASFKVTAIQLELSVLKVPAQSDFDYLHECPNSYSLSGAVYGVYRDRECSDLIETLTTDSEGRTPKMYFDEEGTYYVKEIASSSGYALDATVYTAIITNDRECVITSTEPPLNDPIRLSLIKKNAKDETKVRYLDTAEFTLRYYDTQEDDLSDLEPKYEWVFKAAYSDNNEAEVLFDEAHFVCGDELLLNDYGDFFLPLGTFTIQETKAPQTYLIDETVYIGHIVEENDKAVIHYVNEEDWEYLKAENESLIQTEREAIQTIASFRENGENHYPADGFATVMDTVIYDYLVPGQSYTLAAKLADKETGEIMLMNRKEFVPSKESGSVLVKVGEMDLTDLAGSSYVCYEYLYVTEKITEFTNDLNELDEEVLKEYLVTCHEDPEDEEQTLSVDDLYSAAFVLYKIGDNRQENRLSGAYFDVSTKRTRRDGSLVERKLGTFVTGGIYAEDEEPFTLHVYSDEKMTKKVGSYESRHDSRFKKQAVTILDLDDGVYYVKKNDEEGCDIYHIGKGMIYLPDQEEDTEITFKELIAPIGYAVEPKPFTMTVGHDDRIRKVENYRANYLLYIPVTGRDA